jgi:hypothetical protein
VSVSAAGGLHLPFWRLTWYLEPVRPSSLWSAFVTLASGVAGTSHVDFDVLAGAWQVATLACSTPDASCSCFCCSWCCWNLCALDPMHTVIKSEREQARLRKAFIPASCSRPACHFGISNVLPRSRLSYLPIIEEAEVIPRANHRPFNNGRLVPYRNDAGPTPPHYGTKVCRNLQKLQMHDRSASTSLQCLFPSPLVPRSRSCQQLQYGLICVRIVLCMRYSQ